MQLNLPYVRHTTLHSSFSSDMITIKLFVIDHDPYKSAVCIDRIKTAFRGHQSAKQQTPSDYGLSVSIAPQSGDSPPQVTKCARLAGVDRPPPHEDENFQHQLDNQAYLREHFLGEEVWGVEVKQICQLAMNRVPNILQITTLRRIFEFETKLTASSYLRRAFINNR